LIVLKLLQTKKCGRQKKEKKKRKKRREEQFSESVHCYNPIPPIGRRRPNERKLNYHYLLDKLTGISIRAMKLNFMKTKRLGITRLWGRCRKLWQFVTGGGIHL